MGFSAEPLIPGDFSDAGRRFAADAMMELAPLVDQDARILALGDWWRRLQALNWPALLLPEAAGGAGGSLADLAALSDGAAHHGLPLPLVPLCGVVPMLLRAGADNAVSAGIAAGIATGVTTVCPVLPPTQSRASAPRLAGGRLTGCAEGIEIPPVPSAWLLACDGDINGPVLLLIPAGSAGLTLRRFERIDGRLSADLVFDQTPVDAGAVLASGAGVTAAVTAARDVGAFLTCVDVVASLGAGLEQVIAYLGQRVQFGTPLASFQALRHRVAELYVQYETMRAIVQALLRRAGPDGLPPREVALAKLHVGRVARRAAETMIQLHGGMGMTAALPASRLNKRLIMADFEFGDSACQARRLRCQVQGIEAPRE